MFLEGSAVLHIVDKATQLSAATVLDSHGATYGQPLEGICPTFVEI